MEGIFDYRLPHPALREYVRLFQIVGCTFASSMTDLPVKAYWPRAENCLSFFPKDLELVEYGLMDNLKKAQSQGFMANTTSLRIGILGDNLWCFRYNFSLGRWRGSQACRSTN